MRSRTVRVALVAVALLASQLVSSTASAGPSTTLSLDPIDTKCTDKQDRINWAGGEPQYSHIGNVESRPRGDMYVCWSLYRVTETNKRYNWFVAYLETRWYNDSGPTQWTADAYMSQQMSSSKWAVDNTESATGSFTSSKECGTPFTVSAGFYGASISTTQQLCDEYRVRRGVFDGNSALWDTAKVGKVDRIETVYMLKVAAGSRPSFNFGVEIPRYTYTHNGAIWMRNTNYVWVNRTI